MLQREHRKRAVLIITTDVEFAESVSARVNICFDGCVVYSGTVTAIVSAVLGNEVKIICYAKKIKLVRVNKAGSRILSDTSFQIEDRTFFFNSE